MKTLKYFSTGIYLNLKTYKKYTKYRLQCVTNRYFKIQKYFNDSKTTEEYT